VAGIMGGLESEVGESTTRILIESAWFNPSSIRQTARALSMNSEASQRFQRGADPEMAVYSCDRVAQLLHEICGADIAPGRIDLYPAPSPPIEITLRYARTNGLLGAVIPSDTQKSILERLAFTALQSDGTGCTVRVPGWRHDATREVDLIEEIARFYGYDEIPATVPRVRKTEAVFAPEELKTRALRRYLVSLGLTELMNLTFSSPEEMRRAGLTRESQNMVMLENPLSENASAMRASLIPNLLNTASLNCRRGSKRVNAFELGHIYLPNGDDVLPIEQARLGIVLSGTCQSEHWAGESAQVDFYDCKGILENIFDSVRLKPAFTKFGSDVFLEGHSAAVTIDKTVVAWFGKVRSEILERFDIAQDVYVAEVQLDSILCRKSEPTVFSPMSAFPPSLRDLAVLVDGAVTAQSIVECAKAAGGKFLQDVRLFDVYAGKQVPAGKKSVALNLVFQSHDRTLTDKDTQKAWGHILKALEEKCGATLR